MTVAGDKAAAGLVVASAVKAVPAAVIEPAAMAVAMRSPEQQQQQPRPDLKRATQLEETYFDLEVVDLEVDDGREGFDDEEQASCLACSDGCNTALDGSTALGAGAAESIDFAGLLAGRRGVLIPKARQQPSAVVSETAAAAADDLMGLPHDLVELSPREGESRRESVTLKGEVLTKPTPASPLKPTRSRRGHLSTAPSRKRQRTGPDAAYFTAVAAAAAEENRRCSPNVETATVLAAILTTGCRALCFTKVRRMCEILCGYTTRLLCEGPRGTNWKAVAEQVGTYRGGYTAEDRRAIEAQLLGGGSNNSALQGVVCTNALELGVDIGELDAVVCLGYPGCSASLWQQVGRAGRKGEPALGVVIAYDSPVDAYFVRHPDRLLQLPVVEEEEDSKEKEAQVTTERLNPYLLQAHVICAAAELPLRLPLDPSRPVLNGHGYGPAPPAAAARSARQKIDPATVAPEAALDAALFGGFDALRELVNGGSGPSGGVGDMLSMAAENGTDLFVPVAGSSAAASKALSGESSAAGMVELWKANSALWASSTVHKQCRGPQPLVSIRAVGSTFSVVCTRTERELETVESSKAFFSLYEGSLYQHQQQLFKAVEGDIPRRLAYACPVDPPRPNYITQPMHSLTLAVCKREYRRKFSGGVELLYGRLLVSVQVSAYVKCNRRTFEEFEKIPLHGIPAMEAVTSGVWLRLGDLPMELEQQRRQPGAFAGGFEFDFACGLHAANHALRVAANVLLDCDTADICCEHESNELRVLLYDGAAGGTGLAWEAYGRLEDLVANLHFFKKSMDFVSKMMDLALK